MNPNHPRILVDIALARAAQMCEEFGFGAIAEALWRVPVRLAFPGELEFGTYAACIFDGRKKHIAVVAETVRFKSELTLALFLIHEVVHFLDPQWHNPRHSVALANLAGAKAEMDADQIALEVGEKWLERLNSLGRRREAVDVEKTLGFLRGHWRRHREYFTSRILGVDKLAA